MVIEVKFYAMLREVTGKKYEYVELPKNSSIGDLIDLLIERYGEKFGYYIYDNQKKVRDYLSFMLNGVNVNSMNGFDTLLTDGDKLSILPPIGGG